MNTDSTTIATETTKLRCYVWVVESWGDAPYTAEEAHAACERAEAWLREHEGDDVMISVRMPRRGEVTGTFREQDGRRWYESSPEIEALTNGAWEHALETWPAVDPMSVVVESVDWSELVQHDGAVDAITVVGGRRVAVTLIPRAADGVLDSWGAREMWIDERGATLTDEQLREVVAHVREAARQLES